MTPRGAALLLSLAALPAFGQEDPATTGPHAVTTVEYTQGDSVFTPAGFPGPVEFTAVVHHPTDLANGPYPLVLYLHGRHDTCVSAFTWPCPSHDPIRSYLGYNYSGTQLASHGYIVISISANGINAADNGTSDLGAAARAELIDRHLEFWRTLNTVGAQPFGTQFVGRVDLTRVGTMGHSRGGEGVMRHFSYNAAKSQPFPLKIIVPIAPTDFSRWQVSQNVAVGQFLPYCDGDVSDLQGVHYYDDARYAMSGTGFQSYITVMGANHNFFNSAWTPPNAGAVDDWGIPSDPHCGTGAGNGRLTATQQRDVGLAYLATFFRTAVGNETRFLGYIDGSAGKPPTVAGLTLHASYQGNDSQRRDLNRLLAAADLTTDFLSGASSQTGLSPHDVCGGEAPQPQHCQAGQDTSRQPHTTPSFMAPSRRGLSQLRTGWSATGATYVNQIPAGPMRNVSAFAYLQFRATVDFADTRNPAGSARDFSVRFSDGFGGQQTLRVGQFSGALFYPPGTEAPVPKVLQNTVRLPLSSLTAVSLSNLSEVAFVFDQQPSGALLISDLQFYGSREAPAEMVSPAPGSALTGPTVTFSWTTGSGVSQYWLYVGSSVGAADIYSASQGTATSGTVSNLPMDGRTVFVRLWSLIGSTWQFRDYTYQAFTPPPAEIYSPAPGSTLPGATVTFLWTDGFGASTYWLYVGNSLGGNDIYSASQGLVNEGTVSNLPMDGRTLYVRLWSWIDGQNRWIFSDYTYRAAGGTGGGDM
jgi:hypothetical protein